MAKGTVGIKTKFTREIADVLDKLPEVSYGELPPLSQLTGDPKLIAAVRIDPAHLEKDKKRALWTTPFAHYMSTSELIQQKIKNCELGLLPKNVVGVLGLAGEHTFLSLIQLQRE